MSDIQGQLSRKRQSCEELEEMPVGKHLRTHMTACDTGSWGQTYRTFGLYHKSRKWRSLVSCVAWGFFKRERYVPRGNVQDGLQHGMSHVTRSEITIHTRKSCVVYDAYEREGEVLGDEVYIDHVGIRKDRAI